MTAFSTPVAQRSGLLSALVDKLRAWQWNRTRTVCDKCAVCSDELEASTKQLLSQGHYRAAVFTARLQLELLIWEVGGDRACNNCTIDQVVFLAREGVITGDERNRLNRLYSRASKVVHGRACTPARASGIVREIRAWAGRLTHGRA